MTQDNTLPGEAPSSSNPLPAETWQRLAMQSALVLTDVRVELRDVAVALEGSEEGEHAAKLAAQCESLVAEIKQADPGSGPMPSPAPGSADMLAALKACRDALANWVEIADDEDQRPSDWGALQAAENVIAKAEGRPAKILIYPDFPPSEQRFVCTACSEVCEGEPYDDEGRCNPCGQDAEMEGDDDEDWQVPTLFLNHYRCDHEGRAAEGQEPAEWSDEWDCTSNDNCPVCNAEVEPYESKEISDDDEGVENEHG